MIILGLIGSIVSLSSLIAVFVTVTEKIVFLIITGIIGGFFLFPLQPLLTAYASDVAFPVGQGSITGFLFAFSQTFGFIAGFVFIIWIDRYNKWKIYIIMALHILFFIIALLFCLKTK